MSDDESESGVPDRSLEPAKTNRSKCKGKCQETIPAGALRYGTKVNMMGHDSLSWRCLTCVTQKQAENLEKVASEQGKRPKDVVVFKDVPDEIAEKFLKFMGALAHEKPEAEKLLEELNQFKPQPKEPRQKAKRKRSDAVDVNVLDKQIKEKEKTLDSLNLEQLKELCQLNSLKKTGKKVDIVERLNDHYGKEGDLPNKEAKTDGASGDPKAKDEDDDDDDSE